ncbi:aldehyde dehydrogenase family protein [Dactylosporangium sp. CA-092794]|uniref:aldehyde dehydrogenase family protein n=1 Tax=Dactylosporangium sp. CA-092794 TaxID=3239929 RepID=UPI003D92D775
MSVPHYELFIDGRWVDTADRYEIRNPANGELVATVAKGGPADVDRAVAAARAAHESGVWRTVPPAERARLLHTVADRLERRQDELAALQSRENGVTIRTSHVLHLGLSIGHLRYFADLGAAYPFEADGPSMAPFGSRGLLRREPVGVVGAIVPWNLPLTVAALKVGPALVAGNTMVLKPDEHTPLLALELAREFAAAGLPAGVFNVVTGDGEPTGAYLSGHPDVRKVAFTGSTEVGKAIYGQAAGSVRRVTLELGGKGPNILLPGVEESLAVDGALFAIMANNGEACESGSRLLVPRDRHDEFVAALVERAASIRLGDPLDPATDLGPVISRPHRDALLDHLAAARDQGATIAHGGGVPAGAEFEQGSWLEPTIVTGATPQQDIARREVFGPILTVLSYDSVDEAVAIANDTDYGLSAGVWGDEDLAVSVARRLDAGMVFVNNWHITPSNYGFGGMKQSGIGREGGPQSLDAYTEPKFISVDQTGWQPSHQAFGLVLSTPAPH